MVLSSQPDVLERDNHFILLNRQYGSNIDIQNFG